MLAAVVGRRLATLNEMQTVYSTRDLYDLVEITAVDAHNQAVASRPKG